MSGTPGEGNQVSLVTSTSRGRPLTPFRPVVRGRTGAGQAGTMHVVPTPVANRPDGSKRPSAMVLLYVICDSLAAKMGARLCRAGSATGCQAWQRSTPGVRLRPDGRPRRRTLQRVRASGCRDVHVVLTATEHGHRIVTADPGDLAKVNSSVVLISV